MSSPTYLLDNMVVSYFLNAKRKAELASIADAISLAVVREVHDEALRSPSTGAEYTKWQPTSGIAIRDIIAGGDGSARLGKLKSGTLKGLGEHASIALASEDRSLILVSNDNNAILIALRELFEPGERVVRFTTFLRRAHDASAPPTWWADWLATLA